MPLFNYSFFRFYQQVFNKTKTRLMNKYLHLYQNRDFMSWYFNPSFGTDYTFWICLGRHPAARLTWLFVYFLYLYFPPFKVFHSKKWKCPGRNNPRPYFPCFFLQYFVFLNLYFIQNTSKCPGRQNLGWHPAAVFSSALCAYLHHQHFTPWLSEVTGSCNFFVFLYFCILFWNNILYVENQSILFKFHNVGMK